MDKAIKLRMVFMGTSEFARSILQKLIDNSYNVVAVFTQPDAPQGRKQEVKKSPVKELAELNKIAIFQPHKFDAEAISSFKNLKPDIVIVAAYGKILPSEVLKTPGFGCINTHASLLPKFRGPYPIQNTLLRGDNETGVTLILMNEGVDTGDIIAQEKISVDDEDNSETLSAKLSDLSANLLIKTLPDWVERKIEPKKQNDKEATICQLIEKEDGRIVWEEDAWAIYNKFRAFNTWPGIFCYWKNGNDLERIKLTKIKLQRTDPESKHNVGEIFQLGDKIGVQAIKGVIILEEIQLVGKNPTAISDFLNGHPSFIGSVLI